MNVLIKFILTCINEKLPKSALMCQSQLSRKQGYFGARSSETRQFVSRRMKKENSSAVFVCEKQAHSNQPVLTHRMQYNGIFNFAVLSENKIVSIGLISLGSRIIRLALQFVFAFVNASIVFWAEKRRFPDSFFPNSFRKRKTYLISRFFR